MTIYQNNLEKVSKKIDAHWLKTAVYSMMGGAFVAIGYVIYIYIRAMFNSPDDKAMGWFLGAAMFPTGLIMVVFLGGTLFTSDSLVSLTWIEKKQKVWKLMKHWGIILFFNFVGAFLIAVIAKWAHVFENEGRLHYLEELVRGKAGHAWYAVIGSGILCNLLVAGSVWMVNGVKKDVAKILLIWFPITIFVLGGFQHVVANMFVFSAGWLELSDLSWTFDAIFQNLIPAGFGNWLAGAVMLPGIYFVVEKWGMKK